MEWLKCIEHADLNQLGDLIWNTIWPIYKFQIVEFEKIVYKNCFLYSLSEEKDLDSAVRKLLLLSWILQY